MKLKSLILGSVAAAGLSTAGYAADLGVLTSLDVCDSLGISGLTISSGDNCLAISGKVSYEFSWGDYRGSWNGPFVAAAAGDRNVMDNDDSGVADENHDWDSKVETWLKFVGTAASDFGPASATIKLKNVDEWRVRNEAAPVAGGDHTGLRFEPDEAFVQVGDTTTLMAGKKGTIANRGDDEPFNWLGLFNSAAVDHGVAGAPIARGGVPLPSLGGHVIQVVSGLGNGLTVKAGLEKLETTGTAVGVLEYAGNGITAHVTGAAGGILDGVVDTWGLHAGFTGTFDAFKVRAAGAWTHDVALARSYYNLLASGEATFDMFTIALSGETTGGTVAPNQVGVGGSVGATVTEGVKLNLGARWFDEDTSVANTESYQVAAQVVAAVTETITLTGEIGVYGTNKPATEQTDFYGKAELGWKPGGQFESSLGAEVHQNGAYKVTFKASKEFK